MKRVRKWKEMAGKLGIQIVSDEELEKQRMRRALAAVHEEFMND